MVKNIKSSYGIKYAVLTSLLSKVVTLTLQLYALPMAANSLGHEGFVLYTIFAATIAWFSISSFGISPSLVINLSSEVELDKKRVLFSNAFSILFLFSFVLVLLVLILLEFGFASNLYLKYPDWNLDISYSITVCLLIFFLHNLLSSFEAFRLSDGKLYLTNISMIFGTFSSITIFLFYGDSIDSVYKLLAIVNFPILTFRLLFCLRTSLIYNLSIFKFSYSKTIWVTLIKMGAGFTVSGTFNNLLSHMLPIIYIGTICAASVASEFSALMNVTLLLSGVTAMVCSPLMPALTTSIRKGELCWALTAYKKLIFLSLLFSIFVSVVFVFAGKKIFDFWFDSEVIPEQGLIFSFAVYFVLLTWEVVNYTVLASLKMLRITSIFLFCKCFCSTVLMVLLIDPELNINPFSIMSAVSFILIAFSFPFLILKEFSSKMSRQVN